MSVRFTGLAAWVVQRVSAVYMLLFALVVSGWFWLHPLHGYAQWKAWVGRPAMSLAILAFLVALLLHMWVGLRDVLLDYARPASLRGFLLVALGSSLLGTAAWVAWILARAQA